MSMSVAVPMAVAVTMMIVMIMVIVMRSWGRVVMVVFLVVVVMIVLLHGMLVVPVAVSMSAFHFFQETAIDFSHS